MAELINIFPIDPVTFSSETYQESDISLLNLDLSASVFNPDTDYIEYYIYDLNNNILNATAPFTNYSILDNELYIDPNVDVVNAGFDQGTVNTVYNFYQTLLSSSTSVYYYIKEISANRTELRLASTTLTFNEISSSVTEYVNFRNSQSVFEDFYLNFGSNFTVIANNILLDVVGSEATVLIKLYEPLPSNLGLKSQLWVVDKISDSLAYQLQYVDQINIVGEGIPIGGPNFNLAATNQLNNSTEFANLENYTSASVSQSQYQVNSYFNKPGVEINIDYSEFNNFVNFSSAYARVENFFSKVILIQSASEALNTLNTLASATASANEITSLNNFIDLTITNFDGYEYYLYFESGSTTFPKLNSEAPFENVSYSSSAAQTWVTASLADAAEYDEFNNNYLKYAIPEYIRNDAQNDNYMTFVDMIGQFFDDNVWVYVKDITNKYDADNRLDYGVSKDLVAQILRDFGVKLYQNNYSDFDLYSAFIGTTASGSLFPFPFMTSSLPTPTGYEYVNTAISASNDAVPIDDINKRIYKRLYNNLPYLLKKKGTLAGLRALINVYGVPDTILRISEFGGKDKINTNDWDLWYDQFDYKFATNDNGWIDTEWTLNNDWNAVDDVPATLQFRFQTPDLNSGITRPSQSLWSTEDGGGPQSLIVLEYTGSGFTSGSFSGSATNPYNEFATLKLIPDFQNNPSTSASVYLPFFDGGWWSVMVNRDNNDFSLYAANNIYDGWDGSTIGFISSSSVNVDSSPWASSTNSYFPSNNRSDISPYEPFSGSYQEARYFTTLIPVGTFEDYVMNPQSIEGNGINSGSVELAFRAALGGELYTGSVSIHPKVTGSWIATSSFTSDSNFGINDGEFATNRGTIYYDSFPAGIRNRNTDKIKRYETILAPSQYGDNTQQDLPDSNVLSSQISVQQSSFISESYTNNINYLEVAFSPQNEINDDIINSIGFFDYGDYIGDPRLIPSRNVEYPSLVQLRDQYFLKYIQNYDLTDFVRLIKFFDNSLFKMVKDYVPARTSIATGIVIKQHMLERQKYPLPQATIETPQGAYSSSAGLLTPILFQDLTLTGSIGQVPELLDGQRIYRASSDFESFPLESFTGSQGGTLPNLTVDFAEDFGFTTNQIVNVTQSWDGYNLTPFEPIPFTDSTAQEFINGEFSGSSIIATTGELNPECEPFKVADTTIITYDIQHYTNNNNGENDGGSGQDQISLQAFSQLPILSGRMQLWWNSNRSSERIGGNTVYYDTYQVQSVRINKTSDNSLNLTDYIPSSLKVLIPNISLNPALTATTGWSFGSYISLTNNSENFIELDILSIQEQSSYYILLVNQSSGYEFTITSQGTGPGGNSTPFPITISNDLNQQTILEPFVPLSFENSDCNAVYGNALLARVNETFMDVDYPDSATIPVNQQAIINGDATPSTVQTFNYNARRSTLPRYIGSRNSDEQGTDDPGYYYGSINSNIDSPFYPAQDRSNTLLEFNGGGGSYPEIEKGGAVFVTQMISATGPDNVFYTKQKDQGYTDILNYDYRGYDFENKVVVNQYEGSNATMPPSASQIILTDASIPATSSFIIPADTSVNGTGSIVFNTSNQYIIWNKVSAGTSAIYNVTLDGNGYESTGSQVATNTMLNELYSGSVSGSEYYISLYQSLGGTASGSLNQVLNWPIKITGVNVGSGITYLAAGIKEADFRTYSINNDKVGGNQNVGQPGGVSGVSYGALIWAADKSKRAIVTQAPQITNFSGIGKGCLSKPTNTVLVQQNQEYISRRFGNDPNPNVPLFQTEEKPQSAPKS